jgi:hypothetical protein
LEKENYAFTIHKKCFVICYGVAILTAAAFGIGLTERETGGSMLCYLLWCGDSNRRGIWHWPY